MPVYLTLSMGWVWVQIDDSSVDENRGSGGGWVHAHRVKPASRWWWEASTVEWDIGLSWLLGLVWLIDLLGLLSAEKTGHY